MIIKAAILYLLARAQNLGKANSTGDLTAPFLFYLSSASNEF
jgi:hypothetical protein